MSEIQHTIENAAQYSYLREIDYVFPYHAYLSGQETQALYDCQQVHQQCIKHNLLFKVILETGALPSLDIIYKLSRQVITIGCDFLKTSTGKIAVGATLPAAFAMLSAIKDSNTSCGIKLSGGIRSLIEAESYTHLAQHVLNRAIDKSWLRFGMSRLPVI
jgi:deoxyribose-phosphate aldolase